MDKYVFPALFEACEEGGYTVTFPDLPGCITEGDSLQEAFEMAKEALALYLYNIEEDNEQIPEPSLPQDIDVIEKGSFVSLVDSWMIPVRDRMRNKAIKKTLTIPKWLNDEAEKKQVNFSHVLQDALKNHLGIHEHRQ
ncbi:type II toxin-antitoxin system HicB family antitoxin [Petroclostridium sp. X23]|uniref:type II toxin-antitoxin system HicB family antitoxin n=1 Tax=Petroclostridium sp. X23 TaxID=3045146 RepID=UPI0024ADB111|nr:type II toxin-antitoxin system HicB family antitoxin [Petroclostridium sp. X23]WHH59184.1 type II toxin-antitoxin system HicB family antitoxin [Petroclostridium sp. X23]